MAKKDYLKAQLLRTIAGLREGAIDLKDTPALFTWRYEEEPYIQFELLIRESELPQEDVNMGELH